SCYVLRGRHWAKTVTRSAPNLALAQIVLKKCPSEPFRVTPPVPLSSERFFFAFSPFRVFVIRFLERCHHVRPARPAASRRREARHRRLQAPRPALHRPELLLARGGPASVGCAQAPAQGPQPRHGRE